MQRRLVQVLVFAVASIFLVSFLLLGVPQARLPSSVFPKPASHEVVEEKPEKQPPPPPAADSKPVDKPADSKPSDTKPADTKPADTKPADSKPPTTNSNAPLRVAITETGGSHDEVVAALVHAFGSQNAQIDLYQLLSRYGIKELMGNFTLTHPLPEHKFPPSFMAEGQDTVRPDVFVAGTCELDIVSLATPLNALLAAGKTYLFCVVHHADRWADAALGLEAAIKPWVEAGRVEFWTLSPHTARFLQAAGTSRWTLREGAPAPLIRYFVPVFPVTLPAPADPELSFSLQGDYDPARRNYESIFRRLADFLASGAPAAGTLLMHLLGHGTRPSVPDAIADHVRFDERLDYADYYAVLARTFALLPGFATDEYLDRKASSSVPAALIAGTPLVATQAIVDTYSYLTREAVWLQEEGENELDVAARVLRMTDTQRAAKKKEVRDRCAKLIQGNVERVASWIDQGLQKIR